MSLRRVSFVGLSTRVGIEYQYSHMVDGKGEGFGNKISIQTVAVVDAAKVAKKVYRVDQGRPVSFTQYTCGLY